MKRAPRRAWVLGLGCGQTDKFALSGRALWRYAGQSCQENTGYTGALLGSWLYVRNSLKDSQILDAASGVVSGAFPPLLMPAGSQAAAFIANAGKLSAFPLGGSTSPLWTYSATHVTAVPIVVGNQVVVGSAVGSLGGPGEIDVLDAQTGAVLSSDALPDSPPGTLEGTIQFPVVGMAAANHHLYFMAGNLLYAY
ncbi:MAG TPA: hypothetical protein VFK05_16760 [Polyangiaceae bacterium]|nr:hypothetical protein [Polyangiaceae bacterium]